MMKPRLTKPVFLAVAAANLSACSYIQSLFPDKEKDYQYTTEIAPLVVPPQLSDNPLFKKPEASADTGESLETTAEASVHKYLKADNRLDPESEAPANSRAGSESALESGLYASEQAPSETESQMTEPVSPEHEAGAEETVPSESESFTEAAAPEAEPVDRESSKNREKPVEFVVYDDGESRLRIPAGKVIAWNKVGKALSRNSLEVIERNQEEGLFIVNYDPDEQPYEDDSYWDEFVFLFSGVEGKDRKYWLKLIENNQRTELAILNGEGEPVTNEAALRLLKLIQKTINADQAQ
jgi:outer membrane protein assembly factor BamC